MGLSKLFLLVSRIVTISETKRLFIGHAQLEDREFIFNLLNSPSWIQYIGDRRITTLQDADKYIKESLIRSYQQNGYGLYKMTLKENGEPIGICGLLKRDHLPYVDLGFAVLPQHEGKGYTFEAAVQVLHQAKMELGIDTVLAITSPGNHRSQGLLEKLGFKNDTIIAKPKENSTLLYSLKLA